MWVGLILIMEGIIIAVATFHGRERFASRLLPMRWMGLALILLGAGRLLENAKLDTSGILVSMVGAIISIFAALSLMQARSRAVN